MKEVSKQSVLVILGDRLPQKNKAWWGRFDQVIGSIDLKDKIIILYAIEKKKLSV